MNATLLGINLKAGLLPLGGEVPEACEGQPTKRDPGLGGTVSNQTRPATASDSSRGTKQPLERSCEKSETAGPHRLRLIPRFRLVWSRHR